MLIANDAQELLSWDIEHFPPITFAVVYGTRISSCWPPHKLSVILLYFQPCSTRAHLTMTSLGSLSTVHLGVFSLPISATFETGLNISCKKKKEPTIHHFDGSLADVKHKRVHVFIFFPSQVEFQKEVVHPRKNKHPPLFSDPSM